MALVDPLDLSQFDLTPEGAIFGPLWAEYFSDADQLDTPDLIELGAETFGEVTGILSAIDGPLGDASSSLDAELALPADTELGKAEAGAQPVEGGFQQVANVMPPESFQSVPADLVGPPVLGGLTEPPPPAPPPGSGPPTGPPGRPPIPGEGGGGGPAPTPTPAQQPLVQLLNTSQPGATHFNVGDGFQLTVLGAVSGLLSVHSILNGNDQGTVAFGTLDPTGKRVITGVQTQAQAGIWDQTWIVNGVDAYPVLHFQVL